MFNVHRSGWQSLALRYKSGQCYKMFECCSGLNEHSLIEPFLFLSSLVIGKTGIADVLVSCAKVLTPSPIDSRGVQGDHRETV